MERCKEIESGAERRSSKTLEGIILRKRYHQVSV